MTIINDNVDEPQEDFSVSLGPVTGASWALLRRTLFTSMTTIRPFDHDQRCRASGRQLGQTSFDFTVTLSNPDAFTITVDYTTSDGSANSGSDYVAQTGTLTFDPGVVSQPITVMVNGDTQEELDESFLVQPGQSTNATIADGQGLGTILNDDAFVVSNTMTAGPFPFAMRSTGQMPRRSTTSLHST